jgi:long-chain acyl-CoA synthetase
MHTFVDPIERALRTAGDDVATVCGGEEFTYGQTFRRCRRLAGYMYRLGLLPGDRVAIVSANCHRYLEAYLGLPAAGFVIVPLNSRHADPEIRYAVEDSGARVFITDRPAGPLDELFEKVIRIPDGYETSLTEADEVELGGVTEDSLAGLFYTGGTTGASKGVMLSHRNLIANTWTMMQCARLMPDDRWLIIAPLFHAAGSIAVLATVWTGGRQVVLPALNPGQALDLIQEQGVTTTLGVPTMLAALAEEQLARPREVSGLRMIAHGGSPIATEVLRRVHKAFPTAELVHIYGATETSPIATTMPGEEKLLDAPQARSCGQAGVGVSVRIMGDDGTEKPLGEVGEVAIRGANIMQGYWNKPEQTAAVLRDGWYRSGDLGHMDERGFVYLVDRSKDMIVSGGENVYCSEVEEALYSHPMVLEAAVFGIPDEKWGEAVHAVVVPRGDLSAEELIAHCRPLIAAYKIPKAIDITSEPLPKSGAGKVLKRELREPYWAEAGAARVH